MKPPLAAGKAVSLIAIVEPADAFIGDAFKRIVVELWLTYPVMT